MERMTEEKVNEWVRQGEKEKGGRKREQESTWEVTSGHSHDCEIPTEALVQTSTFYECLPKHLYHILEFNAERYGVTEQMHKEHLSGNTSNKRKALIETSQGTQTTTFCKAWIFFMGLLNKK